MSEVATRQEQLIARFTFADPLSPPNLPWLMEEIGGERAPEPPASPEPWDPPDVASAMATIEFLFDLGRQMARADSEDEGERHFTTTYGYFSTSKEQGERPRPRKPLEVVRLSIGSLEVVLAVSGALATGKVLRYVFALIEEAFVVEPRIRKQRAVEEAERLEAEVRAEVAKRELVRLGAIQLKATKTVQPVAVDFWLGDGDEPPQLDHGESD